MKDHVIETYSGRRINFEFVINDHYEDTNNIFSLYLASAHLAADDTILFESDILFEKELVEEIVKSTHVNVAVVAKYDESMGGTVVEYDDNIITRFIDKDEIYDRSHGCYKTVNIYSLGREFSKNILIQSLKNHIDNGDVRSFYEVVFGELTNNSEISFFPFDITGRKWCEVDDAENLAVAELLFSDEI